MSLIHHLGINMVAKMANRLISAVGISVMLIMPAVAREDVSRYAPKCQEGGILRAIDQSYQDFFAFLSKVPKQPSNKPLTEFLRQIDNYQITAVLDHGVYSIKFLPYNYSKGTIKGAGVKYSVNKCTYRIEDIQGRAPLE
ncbi:hypothetical protein [Xanthomonas sp. LMG 12461]|uniref:hypothetical protein n=1 Tax=Xanthomonas sp. LMG 12461 TaxID=2014543 RepID=UPI001265A1D8|nr:hypothetical protein [Xanthomonas sp. LMG 12461]